MFNSNLSLTENLQLHGRLPQETLEHLATLPTELELARDKIESLEGEVVDLKKEVADLQALVHVQTLKLEGWDWVDYTLSSHYLSTLINDDWSGLEPKETKDLEKFLKTLPQSPGHWDYDLDQSTDFKKCEVSNVYADTVQVRYMFKA